MVIFALLALARPNTFLTEFNLLNLVRSLALVGIVAVGMTFLFIAAEIDLSVGSGLAFLSVVTAHLIVRQEWDWPVAAVAVIGLGALIGLFNESSPRSFASRHSSSRWGCSASSAVAQPDGLGWQHHLWHPGTGISVAYQRRSVRSRAGTDCLAPRDDADRRLEFSPRPALATTSTPLATTRPAAANAGINTRRVKVACFVLTGALTGLAGVIVTGWLQNGNPIAGQAFEARAVIAAVVIGGTNLFGGSGSILGTFLGAAVAGLIRGGLVLAPASRRFRLLRGQSSSWLSYWT